MPKKGKKGKKEDPEVVAARLAQEQAEAEAKRQHEQEVADKAAWVQEQEDDFSRREAELEKLEADMKAKLEGLDAEVLLRARSSIAAAEAREAATESRAVEREEKASQKIMSFRDDEARLRLKEVKVAARERALEGSVKGVAKHLEVTIASKCSFGKGQGILDAQHAEVEACLQGLAKQKRDWEHEEQNMEASLQQKEQEARERVQMLEDRLVQRDFEVQRRMALSVKEVEALVAKEREKAVARQQELDEREALLDKRDKEVNRLLREVQAYEKEHQGDGRPSTASIRIPEKIESRKDPSVPELTSLLSGIQRIDVGDAGTDPREEREAVAEALKDVQIASKHVTAAEELAARPPPPTPPSSSSSSSSSSEAGGLEDPPFADEPLASPCPSEAEAPGVVRSPIKKLAEAPVSAPLGAPAPAPAPVEAPAPAVSEAPATAATEAPAPAPPSLA